MKYFFDTEFIEGFKKPIKWLPTIGNLNKPYHSIQIISIGIVCEDGREYYAVSNEFNPNDANDWVKENVIKQLGDSPPIGKTNKQIAMDILKCFPMYCIDLKQMLDEKAMAQRGWTQDADAEFRINAMKNDLDLGYEFPKQTNEHNALADAKWNYELYKFLQTI